MYIFINKAPKHMKQNVMELNGQMNNSTIVGRISKPYSQ